MELVPLVGVAGAAALVVGELTRRSLLGKRLEHSFEAVRSSPRRRGPHGSPTRHLMTRMATMRAAARPNALTIRDRDTRAPRERKP